ncbi:MAG: hypothetical protein HRU12_03595, partial [Phaeodactylibacter sp.]|nr:hypothetical protein [Phaeodactylibacter sp.]
MANDTWQEVTLTFASAISGAIRLGTNGTNFFSGDLADAVCKDASGSTLEPFYLNEHTDTAVNGLDGLPLVGRNGSVGQYVDAAAVVQEGIPLELAGLGAYGDKLWLDGINDQWDYPVNIDWSQAFELEFSVYRADIGNNQRIWFDGGGGGTAWALFFETASNNLRLAVGGFSSGFFASWIDVLPSGEHANLRLTWDGVNQAELIKDGISLGVDNIPTPNVARVTSTLSVGESSGGSTWFKGLNYNYRQDGGDYITPINIIGNPATVAQLRTTPPQVLGMDFNQYRWFNGVDTRIESTSSIPLANQTLSFSILLTSGEQQFISSVDSASGRILSGTIYSTNGGVSEFVLQTNQLSSPTTILSKLGLDTLPVSVGSFVDVSATFDSSGDLLSGTINGQSMVIPTGDSRVDTVTVTEKIYLGIRAVGGFPYRGLIYGFKASGVFWLGYGPTPWADTIGSNDGTESGSFENVLVPASLSNSSLDALGNAMDLRERDEFNADDSGRWEVSDD